MRKIYLVEELEYYNGTYNIYNAQKDEYYEDFEFYGHDEEHFFMEQIKEINMGKLKDQD